jgi:hypothetical protein
MWLVRSGTQTTHQTSAAIVRAVQRSPPDWVRRITEPDRDVSAKAGHEQDLAGFSGE